jgi:hypothetical protein|tara:strand:+ start:156 stop:2552 length:2397 start_codon:yes stop_codon:yes gene_type:complete
MAVTDPKIIKELDEIRLKNLEPKIKSSGETVNDADLIKELDDIRLQNTFKGKITKASNSVADFFSGTKKTEYPDMPEIGSANTETAGQAFKIAAGLLITPNQKSQAQIIKSQVPGSDIFKDRFNNIIVTMPDGKNFYLNKPGASQQDFLQTTSQILSYIPGYSWAMKKAGKSYFKKAMLSGVAGGSTSLAQDIATMPLGNKEIDVARLAISSAVPVVFEGAISPIVGGVWKKIMGNPSFTKTITKLENGKEVKQLVLNTKGEKAAQAAGIDVTKVNEKFIKEFTEKLSQGEPASIAASQAGAGKFKFRLSRSQASGDEEGIALLFEAAKNSYGKKAQVEAQSFLKQQNIDIENSASNLIKRFDKGEFPIESIEEAGQNIIQGLEKRFTTASNNVETAYNFIDKDGVFQAANSNIDELTASVFSGIKNKTGIIDKELTPATVKAQKVIKDFVNKYKPKKQPKDGKKIKKITPATFNEFIIMKRKLNSIYKAGSNNTDRAGVNAVIKEWTKFVDDNVDNILFSPDKGGVEALKKANKLASEKFKLFDINDIKVNGLKINDKAGKVVMKILNDPDISPNKAIDYIFGRANLGRSSDSMSIIKRLKTVFGVEGKNLQAQAAKNKDFQSLRTGAWEKLIRDSSKNDKFSANLFFNNWKTLKQKNKDLLDELFESNEIKLIDEFANEVKKTFKGNLVNASNTASALSRIIQQVGRGLGGIIGFKMANIQGLLVFRGAFDRARDIVSQKSASNLVNKELVPLFGSTASPRISAPLTVNTNALTERNRIRKAPQLPASLANRYSRY